MRIRSWNRRIWLTIIVFLGCAALSAVFAWRPSQHVLIEYRGPIIAGHRVRALIPRGWVSDEGRNFRPHRFGGDVLAQEMTIQPPQRSAFLRRWLGWLVPPEEPDAGIQVWLCSILPGTRVMTRGRRDLYPEPYQGRDVEVQETGGTVGDPKWHQACRSVRSADGARWAEIEYERNNKRAFEATYKRICNSLRIE